MKLIIPILKNPWQHWVLNEVSFIYVYDTLTFEETFVNKSHNDLPEGNIEAYFQRFPKNNIIYRKKVLNQNSVGYDMEMVYWLETNQRLEPETNPVIRQYWNWYKDDMEVNDFIPIMKWLEYCQDIKDKFIFKVKTVDFESSTLQQYDKLLENLTQIERNGLYTKLI